MKERENLLFCEVFVDSCFDALNIDTNKSRHLWDKLILLSLNGLFFFNCHHREVKIEAKRLIRFSK
jgi:hypothetical protein